MDKTTVTTNSDGLECPHCGHVHDTRHGDYGHYDEALTEWQCFACDRTFGFKVRKDFRWTSTVGATQ